MATWIDLSAHNLALWRAGPDTGGIRHYLLRPIFPGAGHTAPDTEALGITPRWDDDAGGYWIDVDTRKEKLPAREKWLAAFSGALFRDRDETTYPVAQPDLAAIAALPIANPWVWSNQIQVSPGRFFVNEEQALADDEGGAVLCSAKEVGRQGAQPLSPVDPDALEDALTGGEALAGSEALAAHDGELASAPDPASESTGAGKRLDYGEAVPGARKDRDALLEEVAAQEKLFRETGQHSGDALKTLVQKMRRDTLWGTLKNRLAQPDVAASPFKQALWASLYQETPASVASCYWSGKRKYGIPEDLQWERVLSYQTLLLAMESRIDQLPARPSGAEIRQALAGDPFTRGEIEKLFPQLNYGTTTFFQSGGGAEGLREAIEYGAGSIGYGVVDFLTAMKKDNKTKVAWDLTENLLKTIGGSAKGRETMFASVQDVLPFYTMATIVEVNTLYASYRAQDAALAGFLNMPMEALQGLSEEEKDARFAEGKKEIVRSRVGRFSGAWEKMLPCDSYGAIAAAEKVFSKQPRPEGRSFSLHHAEA